MAEGEGTGTGTGEGEGEGTGKGAGEGQGSGDWFKTFDSDTRGWLENRGLDKLDATAALPKVIDGFRNAEKKLGVPSDQLLRLPQDRTVEGSMDSVYNSLGRPEESGKYELGSGEDDADFATWAQEKFHKLGLSQNQAKSLYGEFTNMIGTASEKNDSDAKLQNEADMSDLKSEWGATYERNLNIAQGAIRALGASAEVVDKLEEAMGFSDVIKLFNTIGQKIGEDTFVSGDTNAAFPGLPSTPEGANAKILELKRDKEWVTKYNSGDHEARQLFTNLHKIAAAAAAA